MMKDETQEHIDRIIKLMKSGKTKIGIFNNSGEGKTFLLDKLKNQIFTNDEYKEFRNFHIYDEDSFPIDEPYIMPFISWKGFGEHDSRPKPDAIYHPKYTKAFKDHVMGFEMPAGSTFRDYESLQRKEKIRKLKKQNWNSIEELKEYMEK